MPRATSALVAALLLCAAAPAAALAKKSPSDIAGYWTTDRMKDAKPREKARPGGGGGGTTSDWYRYTVQTPYSGETAMNGKLFFTIDGARYVCSASAVDASAGVNLIWTAGHCVTDGVDANGTEHQATDVLFVPGYLNGAEPFGRWAATAVDSTDSWESSGGSDFRYDLGAARVTQVVRDSSGNWVPNPGATFGAVLGGTRDIAFTTPSIGAKVVSYGYPAAGKFKGNQQYACASTFRRFDPWNTDSPAPMQIGCDMTGGSSGGGWVLDNGNGRADPGEPLVSVNSYGYGFEKTTMYGPQMGTSEAQALYQRLR